MHSNDPVVSVIIPAYNAADYIPMALDSVLTQEGVTADVWVVDDGSNDRTPDVLATYGDRISQVRIENFGGPSRPRNVGVTSSQAPYIAFLDSDDVMYPGKLAFAVEVLDRHPRVGLLCTDFRSIDASGAVRKERYLSEYKEFRADLVCTDQEHVATLAAAVAYRHLLRGNFVGTSSVVCRREALMEAGSFDETMRNGDDADMWRRLTRIGWDVAYVDRVFHDYRVRQDGVSARGVSRVPDMIRSLEKELPCVRAPDDHAAIERRLADLHLAYGFGLRQANRRKDARRAYGRALAYRFSLKACRGWVLTVIGL